MNEHAHFDLSPIAMPRRPAARSHTVRPAVTIARVLPTDETDIATRPWRMAEGLSEGTALEEAIFGDGDVTHGPEVIAAARALLAEVAGAVILYVHRGVQRVGLNPLLPSLLAALDYDGDAFTMRDDTRAGIAPLDFAEMIRGDGPALVIEDPQLRLGPVGTLAAVPVRLTLIAPEGALPCR